AVLEKASQTNAVVCEMRLFADNYYVVFSPLYVIFHEFLYEGYAYHAKSHNHYTFSRVVLVDHSLAL
ncbi:hypothetical protein JQN64_27420, partial [Escherichia coli]|nr:hypothetical protein [Escherichia coli]